MEHKKVRQEVIDQARSKIVETISSYVELEKRGTDYFALCPFHSEKSPSFTVSPNKQFFYCFAGETRVITWDGTKEIRELVGSDHRILTTGGSWVDAPFRSYGIQPLWRIALSRNGVKKEIFATAEHRWFIRGRKSAKTTAQLCEGDRLQSVIPMPPTDVQMSRSGVQHGIGFGDGTIQNVKYGTVDLHDEKADELYHWFAGFRQYSYSRGEGHHYTHVYDVGSHIKSLPDTGDHDYLFGFIAGYLAADGHVAEDGTISLSSSSRANLQWVRDTCCRLGISTYPITAQMRQGYGEIETPIYRIHFVTSTVPEALILRKMHATRLCGAKKKFERLRWSVVSVNPTDRMEEVFCAEVPETHAFALEDNILTGNCFGCGESGDAIDFVMRHQGVSFLDAVGRIVGNMDLGAGPATVAAAPEKPPEWEPLMPVPPDAPPPPDTYNRRKGADWITLTASWRWPYLGADGQVLGYICRFELGDGKKEIVPQTYCVSRETGELAWRWQSFPKPRPIYGLDKLAAHPKAQVMAIEGEKACDAAQILFQRAGITRDQVITIAWAGGGNAVRHTDWSPLAGRRVGLWPDADQQNYPARHPQAGQRMPFLHQPGTSAMLAIYDAIAESADVVKFIIPPKGVADGWDLADVDPDDEEHPFDLLGHLKANSMLASEVRTRFEVVRPEPQEEAPPVEEAPPWDEPGVEPKSDAGKGGGYYDPDEYREEMVNNGYFTILGYDQDDYFIFQHEKKQLLTRKAGQFGDTGLTELAPTQWWEAEFPGDKGYNRKMAVNWLIRTANSRGIYDTSRIRGRGAWMDKGRHVYHLGRFLMVDGKPVDITGIRSAYVYPMARAVLEPSRIPMDDDEGRWLFSVAAKARWTQPGSAALLVGFVMLAPICGALNWRPHVWISGSPGSGKTTLQAKFVGALTRGVHVHATGSSTEAGIRQELHADALPVLIDEFESNNENERRRVEAIMAMIRQTSSETQARTLKGTVTGESQHYHIRSMFCLASINTNLPTKADIDRMSILSMKSSKDGGEDNWQELEADLNKIDLDVEISGRLLARALSMMPTIMETIRAFRRVAAGHLGSQRDADQYGTLLAGYWCLQNSTVPTDDEIVAVLNDYSWQEHLEDSDRDDASKALDVLLNAKLRVNNIDFSVFEMIRAACHSHRQTVDIDVATATATLSRHGIRIEGAETEVWFGITVPNLVKLVKDTPSATDLRGQLLRLPGAKRVATKKYLGISSRGVSLPLAPLFEEADGSAPAQEQEQEPLHDNDPFGYDGLGGLDGPL